MNRKKAGADTATSPNCRDCALAWEMPAPKGKTFLRCGWPGEKYGRVVEIYPQSMRFCAPPGGPAWCEDNYVPSRCIEDERKDKQMNEAEESRALRIAARVMQTAGLCIHKSPTQCRRLCVDADICEKCIRAWLLSKARKELKAIKDGTYRTNVSGKTGI